MPLYDVDTNGRIDENNITIVNDAIGSDVTLVDRQTAQATQVIIRYYGEGGFELAIAYGYIPSTSEAIG